MAHPEQKAFCESVVARFPHLFIGKKALDIGSFDINGNNRFMFTDSEILGIDIIDGPNVDLVCVAHEFEAEPESYDVIVTTETLEHDMYFDRSLRKSVELLKPGGIYVMTCAGHGRPEHGTTESGQLGIKTITRPGWDDYYRNLSEADFRAVLDVDRVFAQYEFSQNHATKDTYFWGIKR